MQSFEQKFNNPKRPARTGQQIIVGRVEDLPPGRSATITLEDDKELALYNVGGQFHAIENFCPHRGAPLAEGNLCDHTVECDWHGWRFDVRTGACLTRPTHAIEAYEVVIEDGWLKIII
jgi:nitrite reductase/ring-hydroxylating ferredoxin subunit